jgi:hypothetical protein
MSRRALQTRSKTVQATTISFEITIGVRGTIAVGRWVSTHGHPTRRIHHGKRIYMKIPVGSLAIALAIAGPLTVAATAKSSAVDRNGLRLVGFIFAGVTFAVMLTTTMVVRAYSDGVYSLESAAIEGR